MKRKKTHHFLNAFHEKLLKQNMNNPSATFMKNKMNV